MIFCDKWMLNWKQRSKENFYYLFTLLFVNQNNENLDIH